MPPQKSKWRSGLGDVPALGSQSLRRMAFPRHQTQVCYHERLPIRNGRRTRIICNAFHHSTLPLIQETYVNKPWRAHGLSLWTQFALRMSRRAKAELEATVSTKAGKEPYVSRCSVKKKSTKFRNRIRLPTMHGLRLRVLSSNKQASLRQ